MLPDQILILTVIVLLPLVPAFLLFKLLPSRAVVKGPLQGLNVALSGAFGGYVALTVFIAAFYAQTLKPQTYRTWHVHGKLELPAEASAASLRWNVGPPMLQLDANNVFYFQIPVAEGAELPDLLLEVPGYPIQSVKLSGETLFAKNYRKKVDKSQARIVIEEPVVFRRTDNAPAYDPNAAQQPAVVTGGG